MLHEVNVLSNRFVASVKNCSKKLYKLFQKSDMGVCVCVCVCVFREVTHRPLGTCHQLEPVERNSQRLSSALLISFDWFLVVIQIFDPNYNLS